MKKVKVQFARALKIARANGYEGPSTFPEVKAWMEDKENIVDAEGRDIEVVKTVTIAVSSDKGEEVQFVDNTMPNTTEEPVEELTKAEDEEDEEDETEKTITISDFKRLRAKARKLEGLEGIKASGVNRVLAETAEKYTASIHENIAASKAYNRRAKSPQPGQTPTVWSSADEAEAFGAFSRLAFMGQREYGQKARDKEIMAKANITTTFTSAGALIPPAFTPRLIDLRESYGVFQGLAQNETMSSDIQSFPRRTGDLTVYSPGEAGTITESNMSFDGVEILARKRAVISKLSNESIDDSALNISDVVATNISWSFSKDIDERGFNGDGTSMYAGDVGIREKLKGLSSTIADIAGLFVGSGNLYSELVLADFESVLGLHPDFDTPLGEPKWIVNKRFYTEVMMRLALASGGVTALEIEGKRANVFLGYPVVFARSMPRTEANSQVCALFGNIDAGAMYGDRKTMEIATSSDRYFEQDSIAIRGIMRSGITVHDVGNASATEADREPGPIVGLITRAS